MGSHRFKMPATQSQTILCHHKKRLFLSSPRPFLPRAAPSKKIPMGGQEVNSPFVSPPEESGWNELAELKGPIWETTPDCLGLTRWRLGGHLSNQGHTGGESSSYVCLLSCKLLRKPGARSGWLKRICSPPPTPSQATHVHRGGWSPRAKQQHPP